MKILSKEIDKIENLDNRNLSYFYYHGDIPLTIKLITDKGPINVFLEANGEFEIDFIDEDGFVEIADIEYIQENFENDEELEKFLKDKEIERNNWFEIIIEENGEFFRTEKILTRAEELLNYKDQDLIDLIKNNVI